MMKIEDVIIWLECLNGKHNIDCDSCVADKITKKQSGKSCKRIILDEAVALIKHQRTEIEEQDAKIEELSRILNYYALQYGTVVGQSKVISKAKAEGIKEFIVKVNEKICLFTAEGSEDYSKGVADALEWYDKQIEAALEEYAEAHLSEGM